MRISFDDNIHSQKYNYKTLYNKQRKGLNFSAHPDYYTIIAQGYDITTSNWFRRGLSYGKPSESFRDVIYCLKSVFEFAPSAAEPKKMLIGGIGESQEPLSLLAVVKNIIKEKPLTQKLDLYTVDLQSRPTLEELYEQSFVDDVAPAYVKDSFVIDAKTSKYRVKDEIFEYLAKVYNDTSKSLWDTRIQEAVKDYPNETFDVASVNNTLGYIKDWDERVYTAENIVRAIKRGGYFITDTADPGNGSLRPIIRNLMLEIDLGIFKKMPWSK